MLHYLIVVPYYFFSAVCLLAIFLLVCRITRVRIAAHVLVGASVILSAFGLAAVLASEPVSIVDLGSIPMLVLGGASFVFAFLDSVLARILPLPIDEEIRAL